MKVIGEWLGEASEVWHFAFESQEEAEEYKLMLEQLKDKDKTERGFEE